MAATRIAKEELADEVDQLILEYLVYQATRSLLRVYGQSLASKIPQPSFGAVAEQLEAVDSFMKSISYSRPHGGVGADTSFRLRLLQFTCLYTLRHQEDLAPTSPEDLASLRHENQLRVPRYQYRASNTLSSKKQGFGACVYLTAALDASPSDEAHASSPTILLLDLLPMFISVTRSRKQHRDDWSISPAWLQLAANFMLQAVLEQRQNNAKGAHSVLDAFSWGKDFLDQWNRFGEEASRDLELNSIFLLERDLCSNSSHLEVSSANDAMTWDIMRTEYITMLVPPEPSSATTTRNYFKSLTTKNPIKAFETSLLDFLLALLDSLERPLLAQLEEGENTLTVDGKALEVQQSASLRRAFSGR